jgi:hypothetical protein
MTAGRIKVIRPLAGITECEPWTSAKPDAILANSQWSGFDIRYPVCSEREKQMLESDH